MEYGKTKYSFLAEHKKSMTLNVMIDINEREQ